ncbi:hypothetical protein Q7P35_006779 [Cladosporium inversicolor]
MAKRKADGDPPSKPEPKRSAASNQQSTKPESPAATAYRRKRAAKLAQIPSDTSATDPEAYDVYDFPSALPSPPSSTRQTPPAVPKVEDTVLEDDKAAHNDTQSEEPASIITGKIIDEDTLINILCLSHDDDLTEHAFDAIMQHAAAAATPGDEFGILFMRSFISRLAGTAINQEWLVEIIGLLQQNLDSLCDRAKSQIQSLGKLPLPTRARLEFPVDESETDDTVQPCDDGAAAEAFDEIETKRKDKPSDNKEDLNDRINSVVPTKSRKSKRKTKDTQQTSEPASKQSSTAPNFIFFDDNSQESNPKVASSEHQPSEAPINSPYDLFVRSATEVNFFTAGQSRKDVKAFNKRVRRTWHRIKPEQQASWVKLFNARPDDVPLIVKGKALLWSQELLFKLLPNNEKAEPEHEHTSTEQS